MTYAQPDLFAADPEPETAGPAVRVFTIRWRNTPAAPPVGAARRVRLTRGGSDRPGWTNAAAGARWPYVRLDDGCAACFPADHVHDAEAAP